MKKKKTLQKILLVLQARQHNAGNLKDQKEMQNSTHH